MIFFIDCIFLTLNSKHMFVNILTSKFVKGFQKFQAQFFFPNHMLAHVFTLALIPTKVLS
jgi:hypothetical protein